MMKKVLIGLGVLLVLVIGVGVVAFIAIDPQKIVAEKKDALLKDVSAKIGREVTAGNVTAKVGTQLFARIEQLQVAGAAGKPPQAQIGYVDVRFSLLRALLSFGNDLHVERFTVNQAVLRAARDSEGRWDFQDILDKTAGEETAPGEKPSDKSFLEGARIARLSIVDGRVEIDDRAMLGRPLAVSDLDVDVSDVVLGDPLAVKVHALLEDGPRKSPIDIDARLAELPRDLKFDPLPNLDVVAKLQDVDATPWGGLLPGDVPAPIAGIVRTDLTAKLHDNKNKARVDGVVFLRGFAIRDKVAAISTQADRIAAPRGSPLDADIAVALERDAAKEKLVIEKLTLSGSGLDVKASLTSVGAGLAGLEKADVTAVAQDVGKLINVLPPSMRGLPEELRVEGPLNAKIAAAGTELDVNVNLDAARVRYMDVEEGQTAASATAAVFDKPNGKPLNLTLHGKRGSNALDVDRFALVVDTAKLGGTMSLPTGDDAPLVADVTSGPVQLASLQSLIPPFKDAIGKGQKVDGTVEINVKAKSDNGKQNADAVVDLRGLDINLAATTVRGSGNVSVKAVPQGGDVDLQVVANLDGISVVKKAADGTTQLNKPAGLPLRLDVNAKKQKTRADVSKLAIAIGKSTINGKGSVSNLDQKTPKLDVDLGNVSLGFDDLRSAIPGANKLPAGGRLTGNVKLTGGTSAESLIVDAKTLNVAFGSSKIAGDVNVKNLTNPVVDVKLPTIDLAFDDIRQLKGTAGDLPAGGRFKGDLTMTGDTGKSHTVKIKTKIDSLTASGSTMRGNVLIENLDKPRFDLNLDADKIDIDALRDAFGEQKETTGEPKKKRQNPHGLSKETRALLADVNGRGVLKADRAIVKGIPMSNFKGNLVMTRGVLKFDTLEFGLYNGTVTATGSVLDLPSERTGYDLKLKGKDIDIGAAIADQTDLGKIFSGRVSPDLKVKGRGIAPGDFAISAEGPAEMSFKNFSVTTIDLLGPIGEAVNATGKIPGMKLQSTGERGLNLDGFTALTRFVGGKMKLEKPIEANSPAGKVQIEGAMGLDAGLDLKTTLNLTPAMVARMTGNKVKLKDPVPVPMRIGGTWDKPKVTGVDVGKLVVGILNSLGKDAVGGAVEKGLDALTGKDDKKKTDDKKKKKKSNTEKATDAVKGILGK